MVAKSVRFSLICLVVLVVVAQLLTGCDESGQKNPKAEVTQTNASAGNPGPEPGAGVQTAPALEYNCDSTADRSAEKRFWCLGLQAWEDSLRNKWGRPGRQERPGCVHPVLDAGRPGCQPGPGRQ